MYYENAHLQAYRGGWRGVLKYRDDLGNWRQRSKVLEATGKRAAARELAEWRALMERQHEEELAAKAAPTFGDVPAFVSRFIVRKEASGTIERRTVSDYPVSLHRIERWLSGIEAAELTPAQAAEFVASMLKSGLSANSVIKTYRLAKQAYGEAVAMGELERNPFDAVKPPKRPRPKHNSLDAAGRSNLLEFLDNCEPAPEVLAGIIALYTGMRRGEVCAITWRDVDIQGRTIRVTRSIGIDARKSSESSIYIKAPKSDRARTVPIPAALVPYLEAERAAQAAACGGRSLRGTYVLTGTDTPLNPSALSHSWSKLARRAGIRGTEGRVPTFHDLRHTYATAAVSAGIDIKAVSSILGHASAAMTLDVYASADPDSIARAGLVMSDAIRRPLAPVVPMVGREYAQTG